MSSNRYTTVPEAPDNLSGEARKLWYMAGLKLVKESRFDDDAYKLLSDLCYWEDQKLTTLERLRAAQGGAGSVTPKMTRSVALKNLKTIKTEIDHLRSELDIEQHEAAWISESQPISEEAYSSLPVLLSACCSLVDDPVKRDLFLLTFLPALSAHIPNVAAEHANGFYTAGINIFLIDKSGAADAFIKKAVGLAGSAVAGKQSSDPYLWQSLAEATRHFDAPDGGAGEHSHAIYELEPQHPGDISDAHTDLRKDKKSLFDRAFEIIPEPMDCPLFTCSNAIVGDTDQYRGFRTGYDAGGLSSFLVYCGTDERSWQSQRPDSASRALNRQINQLRSFLGDLNEVLLARDQPLVIELADGQWQMIDDTFAEKMEIIEELALPPELKQATYKSAIYTLKLTIIFSSIRCFDEDPEQISLRDYLVPDDEDVIASLWIADTCLKHAIRAYEQLPVEAQADAKGDRYHRFYNVLPPAFETSDAVELAEKMNIATRTAKRYLNTLIKENMLRRVRKGEYEKVG